MAALVRIETSTGQVLFEGDATPTAVREMAIGDKIKDVVTETSARVADVGATIRGCTNDLLGVFEDLSTDTRDGGSFSAAVIELGVKVTAEGNVIVAKGSVEANLKVTLHWDFS